MHLPVAIVVPFLAFLFSVELRSVLSFSSTRSGGGPGSRRIIVFTHFGAPVVSLSFSFCIYSW